MLQVYFCANLFNHRLPKASSISKVDFVNVRESRASKSGNRSGGDVGRHDGVYILRSLLFSHVFTHRC